MITKYKWLKQKNGNYCILSVPFFRTFEDEKRGSADKALLAELQKNYVASEQIGNFARVFDGHHDAKENRPGLGFMVNVQFNPENDEELITDVADILPCHFKLMRGKFGGKWPFRSVEYDQNDKTIIGLAFLESQPSFFPFPNLILEDASTEIDTKGFSKLSEHVEKFSKNFSKNRANQTKKNSTVKEAKSMPDEKKPDEKPDKEKMAKQAEGEPGKEKMEEGSGIEKKIDMVVESVNKLAEMIAKLVKTDEDVHENMEDAEGEDETNSSVAYQDDEDEKKKPDEKMRKKFSKNTKENSMIAKMQKRLESLESQLVQGKYDGEIAEIVEKTGQDPQTLKSTVAKFSSAKDKEIFLATAKAGIVKFSTHPQAEKLTKIRSANLSREENVVAKFAKEDPWASKIAKEAYGVYAETIAHPDESYVKKFQKIWPNVEKFVENVVENEKITPGYLATLTN